MFYRFNGAMPFQAWIYRSIWLTFYARPLLQWGHAFSGMDMFFKTAFLQFCNWLQWGHAFSGMDIMIRAFISSSGPKLQWGHAFSGMDIPQDAAFVVKEILASMGPCLFRHGYLHRKRGRSMTQETLQWGHAFSGMDISTLTSTE